MLGVFLNYFSTLGFEAGSLPEPKQPFLARLAGQHAPGICLSLPHRTGATDVGHYGWLLRRVLKI